MIKKEEKLVIGLMSGTSADGIDACLVRIKPDFSFDFITGEVFEYTKNIKNLIFKAFSQKLSLKELCQLNFILGECFAEAVAKLLLKAKFDKENIDLIGSHGQTIYHYPIKDCIDGYNSKSTLQIGEPSIIAKRTGITTIADFRPADIAVGGQGAPLVCFADDKIFFSPTKNRVIQNIGGFSNATVISPSCQPFAFDNGPGNVLINYFTEKFFYKEFDKDGEIANQGTIDENWLNLLMQDEYYFLPPPKTTGREYFSQKYAENMLKSAPQNTYDIIATVSDLTAKTIYKSYIDFIYPQIQTVDEIILGGGGAYNKFIVARLKKYFGKTTEIKTHEDFGISNKFKEAIAFAMLAYAAYYDVPNNIPSCTGANKATVMGKIIKP
ncbi:MAG: anhydro-N-acetylmuramic acid kinase [Candidatus Gastranaerophilales bacterium]|nr:anhydro-N-acetylmuramic acid kinase [Candidatus Gastranaerophilales bacterium]